MISLTSGRTLPSSLHRRTPSWSGWPAPRQKPSGAVPAQTKIVAYNGALEDNADTVAYLEQTFGVTVTEADDPAIRTDFILTVGKDTPNLEAPLAP